MLSQHKSHLLSTYHTLLQHLEEIRQIITTGKTPSGSQVAILPASRQKEMLAKLDAIAAEYEQLLNALLPDWKVPSQEIGKIAAALMWISILLRTSEELVQDLLPENLGKAYGKLETSEATKLKQQANNILSSIREAIELVAKDK